MRSFLEINEIMELNTTNAQLLIQGQDKLIIKNVAIYNAVKKKKLNTQMTEHRNAGLLYKPLFK